MTAPARPAGPAISADVIPLLTGPDGEVRLLLSRRIYEPWLGELALPGVLILEGETIAEACRRALATKAGIGSGYLRLLALAGVADSPMRDERGHTISVSYLAVVDDPGAASRAGNVAYPLGAVPTGLPFDHDTITARGLALLRSRLWDDGGALARALLGPSFTTPQAATVLAGVDPSFNATNTGRLLAGQPSLRRAGATAGEGRGRPATTWTFATEDGEQLRCR